MKRKNVRCLECSHEFNEDKVVMQDEGYWGCPKCGDLKIERIPLTYDEKNVSYREGPGHD